MRVLDHALQIASWLDLPGRPPTMRPRPLPVGLALLSAACLAPAGRPVDLRAAEASVRAAFSPAEARAEGELGHGFYLEGFSTPAVPLLADEDHEQPFAGIEPADQLTTTGAGYGVGAGFYGSGGVGLGLLYLESDPEETTSTSPVRFHGAFLEARFLGRSEGEHSTVTLKLGLGLGVGGPESLDPDTGETAAEVRAALELLLGDHVGLELGGGAFSWGELPDTTGTGTYASVGLSLWL